MTEKRKKGRPRKPDKFNVMFTSRMHKNDLRKIDKLKQIVGVTRSELVRLVFDYLYRNRTKLLEFMIDINNDKK